MNRCPNCGYMFEGKFCPECGTKLEDEKHCPECGAVCAGSQKFCNECGHAFVQASNAASDEHKPERNNAKAVNVLYAALRYVPCALAALFSLLVFAFYAAPVAVMPGGELLGESIPAESYGNVYSMYSGILSEIPDLKSAMLAVIILAVVGVVYAAVTAAIFFMPQTKDREVSVFGKVRMGLGETLAAASVVWYLIFLIVGAVIMGKISAFDGGAGVIASGACPKLLIAFSVIFMAAAVAAVAVRAAFARKQPELALAEAQRRQESTDARLAARESFFATHSAPTKPAALAATATRKERLEYRRACVQYKHDCRRYNGAKDGAASASVVWLDLHKAPIIACSVIVVAAIIAVIAISSVLSNIFRIGKVDRIELGSSPSQVQKILGDPYDKTSTDSIWRYYDKKYLELAEKLEKNSQAQEDAMKGGSLEKLAKLADEETALREQLKALTYKYIEIEFSEAADENGEKAYEVLSVLFDAKKCDDPSAEKKKDLKKMTGLDYEFGYYLDKTVSEDEKILIDYKDDGSEYKSEFTDGSYFHAEINSPQIDFDGDSVSVKWQDKLNAYELTRGVIKIGEVSVRNSWITEQSNAAKIEKLQLPDSVNIIGDDVFSDCYYLKSLIIPSSVTDISSSSFPTHRPNLTDIVVLSGNAKYRSVGHCLIDTEAKTLVFGCNNSIIPSDGSVTSIGRRAFCGCIGLKKITIPKSVTIIGSEAFRGCDKSIREEKGVKYVDKWAVDSAYGVTSVVLRKNTVGIGNSAFEDCSGLTNITMPNSVMTIGYAAFYNCSGLTSITIPNSVTSIGSSAFSGCDGLTSITIGNSVTSIEDYAFYNCCSLMSITIPNSVTSIGICAFRGCNSLTSIEIPNSVTSIGESAFEDCSSLTSITIPNSVTSIRSSTFSGCDKLIQIENGVNYVDKWVINCDGNVTSVTLRDNTVGIGESAFRGCYKLTSITIPNSVTSIGNYAFEDCSGLTSIAIPNGVTSIGDYAFEDCSGLTNITMPNSVMTIGYAAFYNCSSLTSITIPNSVTSIGNSSFEDCSGLTSITIPNSVMSIGDRAFLWCSWLRSITFNGTKAQWNAISKGNNWNYVTGKYTIHCTDGDIEKSVE